MTEDNLRRRAADDEQDEFRRRLQALIVWALQQLRDQAGEDIALAIADQLDRQRWRLMTRVNVDQDGEPDVESLWFHVDVQVGNGWLELCSARWTVFGVSEESAREEARWTAMQHGFGVPDDPSALTDSPS